MLLFVRENSRPHEIIVLIGSQILFSQLRRTKIPSLKITLSKKTTLKESDSVVNDDDDNDDDDDDDDIDYDIDDNIVNDAGSKFVRCRQRNQKGIHPFLQTSIIIVVVMAVINTTKPDTTKSVVAIVSMPKP